MANTRQVKSRINTARNISKITKAMEMVAASKMRRAQQQAMNAKPYAQILYNTLLKISKKLDVSTNSLLTRHESGERVLVVIGTDKGLCGNLNGRLLKKTAEWKQTVGPNAKVVAIGKKAVMFCRIIGLDLAAQFTALPEKITVNDILPISRLVVDQFREMQFQSVDILYMDFINTLRQEERIERLLPVQETFSNISEIDKKEAEKAAKQEDNEYIFEPDAKNVLERILPFYIENTLFHAFLEARASEHSARMVAMKNASENAGDLVKELQLIFNKTRQQSITSELLDITTAQLALD